MTEKDLKKKPEDASEDELEENFIENYLLQMYGENPKELKKISSEILKKKSKRS